MLLVHIINGMILYGKQHESLLIGCENGLGHFLVDELIGETHAFKFKFYYMGANLIILPNITGIYWFNLVIVFYYATSTKIIIITVGTKVDKNLLINTTQSKITWSLSKVPLSHNLYIL